MPYVKRKGKNRVSVYSGDSPLASYVVGEEGIKSLEQAEIVANRHIAALYARDEGRTLLEVKTPEGKNPKVCGYGIVFGGHDLVGDSFTHDTDVGGRSLNGLPVLYDHGLKGVRGKIGSVVSCNKDDVGYWFEAELEKANEYTQQVLELAKKGILGLSTRALDTLVERSGGVLKTWYPVEISLTATPAEPRTKLSFVLKSLGVQSVTGDPLPEVTSRRPVISSVKRIEEEPVTMAENKDDLKHFRDLAQAQSKQIDQLLAMYNESPEVKSGRVGGSKKDESLQFGHFLKAVYAGDVERLHKVFGASPADSLKSTASEALGEMTGTRGGYLVPDQFVGMLMASASEVEHIFPRAFRVPSGGRSMSIPTLDYSSAYAAGQTTTLAGMVMNWTDENATIASTKPQFRQLKLENHRLSGIVPASNELLQDDAIGLQQVLVRLFGEAIGWHRDYSFLHGLGDGEPTGILNAPALITTATYATSLDVPDITAMYKHLMPSSRRRAVWMVGIEHEDALLNINASAATGNPSVLTYLPNLNGTIEPRLLGLPVITTDKLIGSSVSDQSMILCDFSQFVVSDRLAIDIAMSTDAGFDRNQTHWRCNARFDGRPWINSKIAVTPTHSVSPFVALGAS